MDDEVVLQTGVGIGRQGSTVQEVVAEVVDGGVSKNVSTANFILPDSKEASILNPTVNFYVSISKSNRPTTSKPLGDLNNQAMSPSFNIKLLINKTTS